MTITCGNEPAAVPCPGVDEFNKHDYDAILELEWIAGLMRMHRRNEKKAKHPLMREVLRERREPRNRGPPADFSRRRLGYGFRAAPL